MGCGENTNSVNRGANCVSRILRDIVDAQNDVVDNDCCDTSCEQSISDLLGETEQGSDLDTVPVILYCKGTCKPFKGYGVGSYTANNGRKHLKHPVGSFVFRVKKVTKDNCAVLELLVCRSCKWHTEAGMESVCKDDPVSPSCQPVKHLAATGLCLTVDLDCFCHVTCLPAIEAY